MTERNEKLGLVLEGGGVRGIYTAGVLDRLMEEGISFDGVIGVSAGAIHGCSYMSGQRGRSIRYYLKYSRDHRFMSMRSFITTGNVVGVDFCYHELPDRLDVYDNDAFLKNPIPFYVVCTDVKTGKPLYKRITDMKKEIDYLRASASLPYFSRIVKIGEERYLDGGCVDSIPLKAFEELGYGRNLVILTREGTFRKKPEKRFLSGFYHRYPAFKKALEKRHDCYNEQVEYVCKREEQGDAFVIRPSLPLRIGRLEKNPDEIKRVYDIGYADCEKQIEALKKWIST